MNFPGGMMDETASNIIERQTALADFDHARDDFEDALSQVPAQALSYKPEGDIYSIGDQIEHVTNSIRLYLSVLDLMRELEFQEVRVAAFPGTGAELESHSDSEWRDEELSGEAPDPRRNRRAALDAMEEVHDTLAAKLGELTHEEYQRPSPVYYPAATETFPTRASDIIAWLTDHYREHAQQTLQMLEAWKQTVDGGR